MLVFGPGKYRERFPEYLGILLRGHFALMLPGAALLAGVGFFAWMGCIPQRSSELSSPWRLPHRSSSSSGSCAGRLCPAQPRLGGGGRRRLPPDPPRRRPNASRRRAPHPCHGLSRHGRREPHRHACSFSSCSGPRWLRTHPPYALSPPTTGAMANGSPLPPVPPGSQTISTTSCYQPGSASLKQAG